MLEKDYQKTGFQFPLILNIQGLAISKAVDQCIRNGNDIPRYLGSVKTGNPEKMFCYSIFMPLHPTEGRRSGTRCESDYSRLV